jgi:hypothetical protein
MPATIVRRTDAAFVIQVEVPYKPSMLESEQAIQDALNQAGVAATEEVLGRFDTDGSPIRIGPTKMTSMGKVPKQYQSVPWDSCNNPHNPHPSSLTRRPEYRCQHSS